MIPLGSTEISDVFAFERTDEQVTYFLGTLPMFDHKADDLSRLRMICAQMYVHGYATQAQIARAFGMPSITIKRAVSLYRTEGPKGFFRERRVRGSAVLTPTVLSQAQDLLSKGRSVSEVAQPLEIKHDTLRKAVKAGRLRPIQGSAVETSSVHFYPSLMKHVLGFAFCIRARSTSWSMNPIRR